VTTSKDADYAKYFACAGLRVRVSTEEAPGTFLGVNTGTQEGKLIVSGVTAGSPAERAGLREREQVREVDGMRATPKALNDLLAARKAGDGVRMSLLRDNAATDVEVVLAKGTKRSYRIEAMPNPSAQQAAILKDWLRAGQ
jgi:predicted metalloprotease with PDZ domain